MLSMSMPRDTTSVATRMGNFCWRKANITSSRSDWSRSLDMRPHLMPALRKARTTWPTVRLRDVKTMPLFTLRSFKTSTRTASFWWSNNAYAPCFTLAAGLLNASCTVTGSFSNSWAKFRMRSGMVAENSKVWRSFRQCDAMRMMSAWKPMSSMRSASSKMRTSSEDKSTYPSVRCESIRPGVTMTMSAPSVNAFFSWANSLPVPPP